MPTEPSDLREKIAAILNFQSSHSRASKPFETIGHVDADAILPIVDKLLAEERAKRPQTAWLVERQSGSARPLYVNVSRESRVAEWVRTRIGHEHMVPKERAMRLLEEAIELAQAEGISIGMVNRQALHVFNRPAGQPSQEAAGVIICILGWCASNGLTLEALADAEIARIEAKPIEQIRGSLARKDDADLVAAQSQGRTAGRSRAEPLKETEPQ